MTTILKPGVPVALCSDHAGLDTKIAIKAYLAEQGIEFRDFGTLTPDSCDYPDFAHPCALAASLPASQAAVYWDIWRTARAEALHWDSA